MSNIQEERRFCAKLRGTGMLPMRVSGAAVRSVFSTDEPKGSFASAFRALAGLPDKPSIIDSFNKMLRQHKLSAEYDGFDDVFIVSSASLNRSANEGDGE